MLGRHQIFIELNDEVEEYDDLVEIMSNAHLNNNFLSLAREVCGQSILLCISLNHEIVLLALHS